MGVWNLIRVCLAFVTAPFLAIFLFGSGSCLLIAKVLVSDSILSECAKAGNALIPLGGIVALGAVQILGIPVFLFFWLKGWLNWWQVLAASLVIGAIFMVLIFGFRSVVSEPLLLVPGGLSGLLFWAIGIWRNGPILASSGLNAQPSGTGADRAL
jgi:hypothetical protein